MMKCVVCGSSNIHAKEKCKSCYGKELYYKRKEIVIQNCKEYRKTEKGIKIQKKHAWKKNGLVDSDDDNYEKIHQRYIDTTNCDLCNIKLTTGKKTTSTTKSMEHDHKTGLFRNIVCHKCNVKIRDIETPCKSNTGIKNITFTKRDKLYLYTKTNNGVIIQKSFKELDDAICYSVINDMIIKLESH